MKTAFIYSEKYFSYDYGESHPMRIERLRLTYDLCRAYGLFELPQANLVETPAAEEQELLRFHLPDYLEALRKAGRGEIAHALEYGLGPADNPVFPGVWEWSCLHAGASLTCARLVSEGKANIAFNIAGGLHHAHADQASGFCYINDPVLAICHFVDQGKRVLYLDVDAHHGDGVQWAFYDTSDVLTVSFHQDGRSLFPGTGGITETGRGEGKGFSVNVPMLPGTDDHVFCLGFEAVLPRLMETFKPDVVVSQLGVDSFLGDPLAHLELTTHGFSHVVSYLTENAPSLVALGGGGYDIDNVARAWTLAWAIMNGHDLPDEIPQELAESLDSTRVRGKRLRDPRHRGQRRESSQKQMHGCITYLEKHVFPIIY